MLGKKYVEYQDIDMSPKKYVEYQDIDMSQLVWLEGKHTAKTAHCAIMHGWAKERYVHTLRLIYFQTLF